jgi:dipeptidyl aminopeptidase/acylaminoacyl peptidase
MQMYTAIVEQGVEARMCCFKGENHDLSRTGKPLHREKRLQEITGWMDRYTGPGVDKRENTNIIDS